MALKISVASVIPEHQLILAESSKLLASIKDVSKYAIKGASTINYPTLAPRSGQSIALNGVFTSNASNYGDEILALDKKLGDLFPVNVHLEAQNVMNTIEDATRDILRAMGVQADSAAYTELTAALQSAGENKVKTSDIYADIVDMNKMLDDKKVPREGRTFWANTADYAALCKLTKDFIRFDADKTGVVGQIAGVNVVISTTVSGDSILLHSNAVVYALQGEPVILETVNAAGTFIEYSVSEVFGCKATQSGNFAVRYGADA